MKFFATAAALASLVPGILSLTVNTPPGVTYCEPQLISWNGGTAPYYVTIIPGGQINGAPLKTFDTQTGNQLTWIVDIAAGTSITFSTKDSTGAQAYSDAVTIQPGAGTTCNISTTGTGSTMSTTSASGTGTAASSSKASGSNTSSATRTTAQATASTSKSTATQASSSSKASHSYDSAASSLLAALMGFVAFF